jgi:hypothetical protein
MFKKLFHLGQPPYVPEVSSPTDTSNFDIEENDVRQPVRKGIFSDFRFLFQLKNLIKKLKK